MFTPEQLADAAEGDDARTLTDPHQARSLGHAVAIIAGAKIHREHGLELGLSLQACIRLAARAFGYKLDDFMVELRAEPDHELGVGATLRAIRVGRKKALPRAAAGALSVAAQGSGAPNAMRSRRRRA